MKFHPDIPVYGDKSFRGDCPTEASEQAAFIGYLRREYPDTFGAVVVHIKNEGKRSVIQAAIDSSQGMTKGASDIVIPGCPTFVCELKRSDHTKSAWKSGQKEYLLSAQSMGCFVCVALGALGAIDALHQYMKEKENEDRR